MSKVYFEDEKECFIFFENLITSKIKTEDEFEHVRESVSKCEELGYIKKSELEISREEYIKYYKDKEITTAEVLVRAVYYIELLEKALEAK